MRKVCVYARWGLEQNKQCKSLWEETHSCLISFPSPLLFPLPQTLEMESLQTVGFTSAGDRRLHPTSFRTRGRNSH